jgi:hypothetical protein
MKFLSSDETLSFNDLANSAILRTLLNVYNTSIITCIETSLTTYCMYTRHVGEEESLRRGHK